MEIWPDTVETARWTITCELDLSDPATAQVELDGSLHTLTWAGPAAQGGGNWVRDATILVRGANGGSGQLVTKADYEPVVYVTAQGETIPVESDLRFHIR